MSCLLLYKALPAPLYMSWSLVFTSSPFSLGDYELDVSPYEDTVTSKPWKMNLSKLSMLKPGVEDQTLGCGKGSWAWALREGGWGEHKLGVLWGRVSACCVRMEV